MKPCEEKKQPYKIHKYVPNKALQIQLCWQIFKLSFKLYISLLITKLQFSIQTKNYNSKFDKKKLYIVILTEQKRQTIYHLFLANASRLFSSLFNSPKNDNKHLSNNEDKKKCHVLSPVIGTLQTYLTEALKQPMRWVRLLSSLSRRRNEDQRVHTQVPKLGFPQACLLNNHRPFCSEAPGLPTLTAGLLWLGGCGHSQCHTLIPWSGGDGLCFSPSCPRVGVLGVTSLLAPQQSLHCQDFPLPQGSWKESSETSSPATPAPNLHKLKTGPIKGTQLAPRYPLGPGQGQGGSQDWGLWPSSLWIEKEPDGWSSEERPVRAASR